MKLACFGMEELQEPELEVSSGGKISMCVVVFILGFFPYLKSFLPVSDE